MMKPQRKLVFAVVLAACVLASPIIVLGRGNGASPLGLEIAATFDEVITAHQTAIDDFITEHRLLIAETNDARMAILEEKHTALHAKLAEVNETRTALIDDLQAGTIDEEEFSAEMRALATDLASTAQSMGDLGGLLSELGQSLGVTLQARADALSAQLQAMGDSMAGVGQSIADELGNRDLPIPDNLPGKPDGIPGGP
jgi:hypothetical protein